MFGQTSKNKKRGRKASVTVMGLSPLSDASDGRYNKQKKKADKARKKQIRQIELNARTCRELCLYIENTYRVEELDRSDERYRKAYMGVKSHLVFREIPDSLPTKAMKKPDHPPRSENDPDYAAWDENREQRFKEAVMLPPEVFKLDLHVYVINITSNDIPVAWLEVYVEQIHEYLAFSIIPLEYEEHYLIDRTIKDIVCYFGASKADKDADNERYNQLLRVLTSSFVQPSFE